MPESYSVVDLTIHIRDLLDSDAELRDVWVTGEISNLKRADSGHWYFTLKDSAAALKCVMWRSSTAQQRFIPQNGDAVSAHGYVGVYEPQGVYQLYADRLRPVGLGDLYQQMEQIKAALEAEGLFDAARKRALPLFPLRIGVVTSADAAAFQDVQNILRRRFPLAQVVLSATQVQGEGAPPLICAALERLNVYGQVDVILMVRGGGSIEDLWAFNDERVARAIAASRVPVICGVGHETDFTIADFAADLRAPTPSAAAELATPDLHDLRLNLRAMDMSLMGALAGAIGGRRERVSAALRSLRHVSPAVRIRTQRQRLDDWNSRMNHAQRGRFALLRERLSARESALKVANPQAILSRGYAIVTFEDGRRVNSAREAQPGDGITVQVQDGAFGARVEQPTQVKQQSREKGQ